MPPTFRRRSSGHRRPTRGRYQPPRTRTRSPRSSARPQRYRRRHSENGVTKAAQTLRNLDWSKWSASGHLVNGAIGPLQVTMRSASASTTDATTRRSREHRRLSARGSGRHDGIDIQRTVDVWGYTSVPPRCSPPYRRCQFRFVDRQQHHIGTTAVERVGNSCSCARTEQWMKPTSSRWTTDARHPVLTTATCACAQSASSAKWSISLPL